MSGDARVAIHSLKSWDPSRQYVDRSETYSCLSWSFKEDKLAVGLASGGAVVWDVERGIRTKTYEAAWTGRVDQVAWNVDGNALFGCAANQQSVVIWDEKEKNLVKLDKRGVSAIAVRPNGGALATASTRLRLARLGDGCELFPAGEKRRTLAGATHATPVTTLAWSRDGRSLASASGTSILVTDCVHGAVVAVTLASAPLSIALRRIRDSTDLAALCSDGTITVRRLGADKTASVRSHGAIALGFPLDHDSLAVCCTGGALESYKVREVDVDGALAKGSLDLLNGVGSDLAQMLNDHLEPKPKKRKVAILNAHPMLTTVAPPEEPPVVVQDEELYVASFDDKEASLEARLQQNGTKSDTKSLGVVLAQALQASDDKLLEEVLQHTADPIIAATVQRLKPALAVTLLRALTKRLERRPARARGLAAWATATITAHAPAMARQPNIETLLGPLDRLLQQRVELLPKLRGLVDRFDVALARLEHPSKDDIDPETNVFVLDERLQVGQSSKRNDVVVVPDDDHHHHRDNDVDMDEPDDDIDDHREEDENDDDESEEEESDEEEID